MSSIAQFVVIIDSDAAFCQLLAAAVRACGVPTICCGESAADAERLLQNGVEVVFFGMSLGREACARLLDRCFQLSLVPTTVAVGRSSDRGAIFDVAKSGAHLFCERSFSARDLEKCLHAATSPLQSRQSSVPHDMWRMGVKEAQQMVRRALFEQAWRASGGNKRHAARLLGVTRRAVQLMARDYLYEC